MQSCPLCNKEYQAKSVRIAAQHEDTTLIHLQCQSCSGALMAAILQNGVGSSSVGMITDLSFDDVTYFWGQKPIEADDCLALYEFLKTDNALEQISKKYESKTSRKTKRTKSQRSAR